MQRFFIDPQQISHNQITLSDEIAHQVKHVLRFRLGDSFICCCEGQDYLVRIELLSDKQLTCSIVSVSPSSSEPRTQVVVAQSLPKGDKLESIIQKGTEIGASSFLLFTSNRTIVKWIPEKWPQKQRRWQKIIQEAAEQSRRGQIPAITFCGDWSDLVRQISTFTATFIFHPGAKSSYYDQLHGKTFDRILLIIGPEGGFAAEEVQLAEQAGAISVHMGPRILRTETASLVALANIFYEELNS